MTEEEIKDQPLKVQITNHPEIKVKNPTSEDTIDETPYVPTEEQIKEMTDAQ